MESSSSELPVAPRLVHRLRSDIVAKWEHLHKEEENEPVQVDSPPSDDVPQQTTQEKKADIPLVIQYIYHSNAQTPPTGELAFSKMTESLAWASRPLIDRLHDLCQDIPVTFLYGEVTAPSSLC